MTEMEIGTENPKICAILLAAGSSTRMGSNKMLLDFGGKNPIELCLEAFSGIADEAVITVSQDTAEAAEAAAEHSEIPVRIVQGGARRSDSVLNALTATDADIVAIHDCARCFIQKNVISASIESAKLHGCGIASIRPVDTVRADSTGEVIDRNTLLIAQTPQSFDRCKLLEAYDKADTEFNYTDDASIYAYAGNKLFYSEGSKLNQKLTTPEDIDLFRALFAGNERKGRDLEMRIGFGEDTHRLTEGRKLILGGVEVPFEKGLDGHSDADVLTHAVIDAVLGAAALGDIGQHFPDSDPAYKGINSLLLAKAAASLIAGNGFSIGNIDSTIIAQRPKLSSYRDEMRKNLAEAFGIPVEKVSVKFTTPEHTGPEGRGESMTARACAMLTSR